MANVDIPEGLEELFEQTWFDHVLHYGLLVGAIFQLVCIAAIVVIPPSPEEEAENDESNGNLGSSKQASGSQGTGETHNAGGSTPAGGGRIEKEELKGKKKKVTCEGRQYSLLACVGMGLEGM